MSQSNGSGVKPPQKFQLTFLSFHSAVSWVCIQISLTADW